MAANNHVTRLLNIFQKLRAMPNNSILQACWADIFGVNAEDAGPILILLADLIKLTDEAKRELLKQKVDHALYLRPFVDIQRIYRMSLDTQQANVRECLNDGVMTALQFGSELLTRTSQEKILSDDEVSQISEDVLATLKHVYQSQLPDEIKTSIIGNLEEIKRSLDLVDIFGTSGIQKAVAKSLGSTVFYPKEQIANIKDDNSKAVLIEYINLMNSITTITANSMVIGAAIAAPVIFLLGPHMK